MAKVLVVDDEAPVRFTLAELLAERGHRVVEAASGAEALASLDCVEAVITDLSMPGMDGLALLAQVVERVPGLPGIVLTAGGSERHAVAAMKAGAHEYLAKPFDVDEVALVIERAVAQRRLRARADELEVERIVGHRIVASSPAMRKLLDA